MYVVWEGHGTNGYNDISFKVSKNGGTSFRNTINLSYRPSFLGPPQIAAAGNNVYVVWEGHGTNGYNDISFKVSKNGGTSFINIINLNHSVGGSFSPQIAAAGNNVYVVWEGHGTNGYNDISFKVSKNGGTSFINIINLNHSVGGSFSPQIAASWK